MKLKIALVHDYLTHPGGAERVLFAFHKIWPEAPIYTLVYNRRGMKGMFDSCDVRTSFLQRVPLARSRHRLFPLVMPMAVEQFDFSEFDVVLSSSTSFAKGILTGPSTSHICYCHTPMRYVWDDSHRVTAQFRSFRPVRKFLPFALGYVRFWDGVSSSRPDEYIANSLNVAKRIQKYYRRNSKIVYPPLDLSRFSKSLVSDSRERVVLMVGRLLPYKGFDVGIRAAHFANIPLRIIGSGPETRRLKALARSLHANVEFVHDADDAAVEKAMRTSAMLLFPGEEDFGIVPLEAAMCGCPVIAYNNGGAKETIIHGITGLFVNSQNPEAFARVINECLNSTFDFQKMQQHAMTFSQERFQREIQHFVQQVLDKRSVI